ncbi:hypothetical protein H1164_08205 [Thermoactinomyces daqus]|uniref:Uncharacterized protein n=1 Tax=Thermoactinomyces daqus TaxID=1329516 RepID=A0A7W1XA20_9BACL|nr:hypothetical protein [Thermoactinomyces daqus]MBA4542882.1 hypothetical protein [Thermoactinomyces daqus]
MKIVFHDGCTVISYIIDAQNVEIEDQNIYWNNHANAIFGAKSQVLIVPDDFSVEVGDPINDTIKTADLSDSCKTINRRVNILENIDPEPATIDTKTQETIKTLTQRIDQLEARIAALGG